MERVHAAANGPTKSDFIGEQEHWVWTDTSGLDVIELHRIEGITGRG